MGTDSTDKDPRQGRSIVSIDAYCFVLIFLKKTSKYAFFDLFQKKSKTEKNRKNGFLDLINNMQLLIRYHPALSDPNPQEEMDFERKYFLKKIVCFFEKFFYDVMMYFQKFSEPRRTFSENPQFVCQNPSRNEDIADEEL